MTTLEHADTMHSIAAMPGEPCADPCAACDAEHAAELDTNAAELGAEHGRNAASWPDVTNPVEAAAIVEAGGMPEEWADNMAGPLSGEWADGPTPASLAAELGMSADTDTDAVCTAYELAYQTAYDAELYRRAEYQLAD